MKVIFSLACLSQAIFAQKIDAGSPVTVSPPETKPNAAVGVPKDFVGFGMESAFVNNFDNDFSSNLVSALAHRMGAAPILRFGGTSGDYFTFNPNQKEARTCKKGPCNSSKGTFVLGPSFFNVYGRFKDAKIAIQAPLENPINTTNTLEFVSRAWSKLDNGKRAAAIALGNEVEFIYKDGAKSYVDAALKLQGSIIKKLSLTHESSKIFEAGNIASGSITGNKGYQIDDVLKAGINKNGLISVTAEHWYQVSGTHPWTDDTMQRLMTNHSAITERFKVYAPNLKASQSKNIPYAIDEDAAVLGGAPITFAGGFGFTLWSVDFNLVAMSRGVARVSNLAARPSADRAFWCPDNSGGPNSPGPQVRAPYPAAIFVADFIGKGNVAVSEIDTKRDLLSAYAAYDSGSKKLQRVALVNMRLYNGTKTDKRGKETFKVQVGKGIQSVKVQRLHAERGVGAMGYDFGGSNSNVSWAGEQWSHSLDQGKGHYTTGKVEESTVKVTNGVAPVDVPDSEAVMVFVQ